MKATTPVLALRQLNVRFKGSPVSVLDDISLQVEAGETLALVGESGCGKSITSLALMGLLPDSAEIVRGEIAFLNRPLQTLNARDYANIRGNELAMIFQEPMTSLNPAFTLGDQLSEAVLRHHAVSRREAMAVALAILEKVQIPAAQMRLKAYPHQLSGGMRQRVMIAMALINRPKLLIADEPTTALDVTIQAQILALLNSLQKETGTAVLMITHDLAVVAEVAQRVAVMYAGQVVETGDVAEIFRDPQHPYTIGLMGSIPGAATRTTTLATIPGTVPLPEQMPQGCRFATRCPFAETRCHQHKPALQAIGVRHQVACFRAPLEEHVTSGECA
ncbi:ABC transporter ATP-binding protein [Erwinia sp. 198]|uniref:ABC transporter ATP-binding protein n=1 Tax=Erwinia sp. 198 TaxID=2022746 RepID=UPI000F679DC5|nr:ABC transporter ATP-binding protein [Erwinia sp. 198]RRZ91577.1 ABC transporter ATP-binding protein [Erwinia sp. 198]